MLRTTRSSTFCSRKLSLKVNTARAKSSCGTTANLKWSDLQESTRRWRSETASCDWLCMARSFGVNGQSSKPEWERELVKIGSCRRWMTNSPRQITARKPSPHRRCPARFHGAGPDVNQRREFLQAFGTPAV